jgi:ankyrin repeat protein
MDEYIVIDKKYIPDDDLLKDSYFDKLKNTEIGSQSECNLTLNEISILNFSNMNVKEQINTYIVSPDYFKYYSACILMDLEINKNVKCLNFDEIRRDNNMFFKLFVQLINIIDDPQIKINFYKKYVSQIHDFYFDQIFDLSLTELSIQQIVDLTDASNNTALIYACKNKNNDVATQLITTYKNQCLPEHINDAGNTSLILTCSNKMNDVAILLITTYLNLCKPDHINNNGNTALTWTCWNKMDDVSKLLITTFVNQCRPEQFNNNGNTALIYTCWNKMNDVAILLITTFGNQCKPEQINKNDNTALMWTCSNKMDDVAKLLITTFVNQCGPEQINEYGCTALMYTCFNKMNDVAILLITTFRNQCRPNHKNNSAFYRARANKMDDVATLLLSFV